MVVVVLPFEPVMATMFLGRNCEASSISPITGSPSGAGLHQRRRVHRNAGADHDQVLSAKSALAVSAGFDRDAVIEQDRNFFAQLVLRLGVGDRDLRASRLQKQSRGHAGLAQADDEHAFVVEIHEGSFYY